MPGWQGNYTGSFMELRETWDCITGTVLLLHFLLNRQAVVQQENRPRDAVQQENRPRDAPVH